MLRVLIVDDEPIYRLALREMVPWEQYGCEIAAESSNGQDALRVVKQYRIDLVLIDIHMPIMSGLEFVRQLRNTEEGSLVGVVVLSAYSNYEYVREAFLYGVYDYIIKEDMEPEHVGGVISKAVDRLNEQIGQREQREKESLVRLDRVKEGAYRSVLLNADLAEGTEQEAGQWLESLTGQRHILCSLLLDRSYASSADKIDSEQMKFLVHAFKQVLEGYKTQAVLTVLPHWEVAAVLIFPHSMSEYQIRALLAEVLQKAVSHLREYVNLSVTIGVAPSCEHYAAWTGRHSIAQKHARMRFHDGLGRVFFEEDVATGKTEWKDQPWKLQEILKLLESGNNGWAPLVEDGLNRIADSRRLPPEVFQPYKAFLWELGSLLYAKGLSWDDIGEGLSVPSEKTETFEQISHLNVWFRSLVQSVFEGIDPKRRIAQQSPPLVDIVKRWIERHLQEPISLAMASEVVDVSESYLSKVFAKETGETFVEYIMRKRIESAIQMMGSGMKLYEIAEKVGYPNQGHFSKVFKKVTGKTPHEYREELQAKRSHEPPSARKE
ncbi:response regulator transcription factor [Cohnella phaseoli]|uniref:Two-component system response regulator YesN n=1 Tax=Cohnella phaseoli TaxID=456490 RepID=A0A3D9INY9_9BACL|nr:response regulator [Cohnella phaseoli]RED63427.1 two-component system response regulator YesN [Cohnella phaseoli]